MSKFYNAVIFFLFIVSAGFSQDSLYARKTIDKLCSKKFHGRGYVKHGDNKAAGYLSSEFKRLNVTPLSGTYFQEFFFPVNTFNGRMQVRIDDKNLVPGVEFIVYPASSGAKGNYKPDYVDSASLLNALALQGNSCLVVDMKDFNSQREKALALIAKKRTGSLILLEEKKLTWSVAQKHYSIPIIVVLKSSISSHINKIFLHYHESFKENHRTQNIIGKIDGRSFSDSFVVVTAHYDHLGMMGCKTYFPGANDNASGVSMLLNLAQHYSSNLIKPKYTLLFILFAGEEAGLVGSKYFTEHPLINLKKIKFLINLDLLGTGDEGMMVVNATEHKKEFEMLKEINDRNNYLSKIGERGKAQNSDHYYFSEKNVPAFFFYTMGGIQAYHDIYDQAVTLPLTKFKEVFKLTRDFIDTF